MSVSVWASRSELRDAVNAVLEMHTRVITDQHVNGTTAVCEQCSEDRMFALWPCETFQKLEYVTADSLECLGDRTEGEAWHD